MKRVGILTMHKPINYGSALQAWATLKILEEMGYEAELIDYIYPNKEHKRTISVLSKLKRTIKQTILGSPWKTKTIKFKQFWELNYRLSKLYPDRDSIIKDTPDYDIYVVGSDQVWNPNMIKGDSTFLLDFVPKEKKKISFSSSFAVDSIPEQYQSLYKRNLSEFSSLSVRESNGIKIIKDIIHRNGIQTLDPTLLLDTNDYESLVSQSNLKIREPYILVYMLKYAFDPYPYATKVITEAYNQTGLKIVCIDFSHSQKIRIPDFKHLNDAISPQDFINLFKNSEMVITNSFHGSAFAINYNKSLYAITSPDKSDDRVSNLLMSVGLRTRILKIGDELPTFDIKPLDKNIGDNLYDLKSKSKEYLSNSLN